MNRQGWLMIGVVVLLAVVPVLLRNNQNLQSQVLVRPPQPEEIREEDDCLKLSEEASNSCLQRLAIEQKDESICKRISKASFVKRCEREVQLAP